MDTGFIHLKRDDGIWHFRFEESTPKAVDDYLAYVVEAEAKIVAGEIVSKIPVPVLWEIKDQIAPLYSYMIEKSKRIPHVSNLQYRVAYLTKSLARSILIQTMIEERMKTPHTKRAFFLQSERDEAIAWLLQEED